VKGSYRLSIVGLGPGSSRSLGDRAREALYSADFVVVRTARHPVAAELVNEGAISCDDLYEAADTYEEVYQAIVSRVEELLLKGSTAYAVPGSPLVAEVAATELARRHPEAEVVLAPSCVDLACLRLGIDPALEGLRVGIAEDMEDLLSDPSCPVLLLQLSSRAELARLAGLVEVPPGWRAAVLSRLDMPDESVKFVPLGELVLAEPDDYTMVYLPPRASSPFSELSRLIDVVATLRMRCPWDRAQTHRSLARYCLEEAYEAYDAMTFSESATELAEELGDVLFQVLIHCQIASEEGGFDLKEVARRLADKLVARHPHVFGNVEVSGAEEVAERWEQFKQLAPAAASSPVDGTSLEAMARLGRDARLLQQAHETGARAGVPPQDLEVVREVSAALGRWSLRRDERQDEEGREDTRGRTSWRECTEELIRKALFAVLSGASARGNEEEGKHGDSEEQGGDNP
jgi:tetrapyrrole methylase family protein/MazG family protein